MPMNQQLELATAMLAVSVSVALLLVGSFYLDRIDSPQIRGPGAALTRQADAGEGLDPRQISERSPYMRTER
jgi:hypothetical protein